MTDYFALLGEERRPYLDPERVKQTFRELGRREHPDRQEAGSEAADNFAQLNQAQQTLRDPKLRLGYLIGLEFPDVRLAGPAEVPRGLAGLFGSVHGLLAKVDALLARKAAAPSSLSRALLTREELGLREQVEAQTREMDGLYAEALEQLRGFDATWNASDPAAKQVLVEFYQRFSYLSRWLDQLRERLFQLGQ